MNSIEPVDEHGWESPVDWPRVPIRSLTRTLFVDGDWIESPYITDSGVRLIQTGNIGVGRYKEQGFRYVSDETFDQLRCTEVLPGDLLICRLADPVGRACVAPDLGVRMITSVDVTIVRPKPGVLADYVALILSTERWLQRLSAMSQGGTRDRIARLKLGELRVPLPDLDTQRRIVNMLDAETARIDTLIEKNERLLAGLVARWEAQLERSLAAWAGGDIAVLDSVHEVTKRAPAGWRATRIDSITAGVQDKVTLAEMAAAGEVVHYTIEELGGTGKPRMDDGADIGSDKLRVRGDELLFSRLNPRKGHVFEVAIHDELAVASGEFAIMRPLKGITTRRFLYYYLTTPLIRGALDAGVRSVTKSQQRVSFDRIWQTAVALPPLAEQLRLVDYLDGVRAQLDALRATVDRQQELLRLRRQALVTAAVTGQIDV